MENQRGREAAGQDVAESRTKTLDIWHLLQSAKREHSRNTTKAVTKGPQRTRVWSPPPPRRNPFSASHSSARPPAFAPATTAPSARRADYTARPATRRATTPAQPTAATALPALTNRLATHPPHHVHSTGRPAKALNPADETQRS
jgi:hypothetical protein